MATHNPYPFDPTLAALWEEGYAAGQEDLRNMLLRGIEHYAKVMAASEKKKKTKRSRKGA